MSDLSRFQDPVWDKFFDFVFAGDEALTRNQVQEELRHQGIDTARALSRVEQALRAAEARTSLELARNKRPGLVAKLSHVVAPVASGIRNSLRQVIAERFEGTAQAAYFRKLEAATDEDLQSLLDDLYRLEAISEESDDARSTAK